MIVGAVVGFFSTLVSGVWMRRWEGRVSTLGETFTVHLPAARRASFTLDADSLGTSDRLVRSCQLLGAEEGRLAFKMAELAGAGTFYRRQAGNPDLPEAARTEYEEKAIKAQSEYGVIADELQERLTMQFQQRTWLERRLLP